METRKRFLAAWLAIGATGPAFGQSSLTLYGIADIGPTYVSNVGGSGQFKMQSGVAQQSRFGFRGREDIGNNLSVIFALENAFDLSTGKIANDGALFSRQAWVGVRSAAGTLTAGRQTTVTGDTLGRFTGSALLTTSYLTTHPGDYDLVFTIPAENSLKYASPEFAGFSAEAQYAFGGVPGSMVVNSQWNFGANYSIGSFSMAAAYYHVNGPHIGILSYVGGDSNPFGETGPSDRLNTFGIGVSYTFAKTFVHALVTQASMEQGNSTARTYEIGARQQFSPTTFLGLDYNFTTVFNRANLSVAGAMLDYKLSKRTDVYLVSAYEWVNGMAANGNRLVAQLNDIDASGSPKQFVTRVGLRHLF